MTPWSSKTAKAWLVAKMPLMKCGNKLEFMHRLQWLSEGMLRNNMKPVRNYVVDPQEIEVYREYKAMLDLATKDHP